MRKQINLTLVIATIMFFSQASAQQTAKMTSSGVGYMEYLPQGYNSNTNKYPVVIALHGIKEKGNTLADVPRVANVGLPKLVKYGQQYPFILISPQLKTTMSMWSGDYVMQVVNYVKTKLRIDEKRIYLTGLSLGGYGVWKVAAAYPSVFAAMVPICSGGNALSAACTIAKENVATWAFHGT
jgi:predicted peptidase